MSTLKSGMVGAGEEGYQQALDQFVKDRAHGRYPRTIFIGLGGSGAKSLLHLRRLILERFGRVDALEGTAFLSIDTETTSDVPPPTQGNKPDLFAEVIRFRESERVNLSTSISGLIGDNLKRNQHIQDWWDASYSIPAGLRIETGAGQIRPLARLCFFATRDRLLERLTDCWRRVTSSEIVSDRVDTAAKVHVVIIAGWAGGTGSGTFLDMAAMVRGAFPESSMHGIFVLPGVFRAVDSAFAKLAANGYACLMESNHTFSHPWKVRWTADQRPEPVSSLFDHWTVYSGTNIAGQTLADDNECFRAIGEALFLPFSAGQMAAWIQGVQVNRKQYLSNYIYYPYTITAPDGKQVETHGERWYTPFSAFGISKLSFPSWRLLNFSKYELAARMIGMLDPTAGATGAPGSATGPGNSAVTPKMIARFMYEAGCYQGELEMDDGSRQRHAQIQDLLFRLVGVDGNPTSIPDDIGRRSRHLVDDADSMFTEKSTRQICADHWRAAERGVGDPQSPGSEGEWVRQIRQNRQRMEHAFEARLWELVEVYRLKPGMGPSGVIQLIKKVREQIQRPGDQERYADWFRRRQPEQRSLAAESKLLWDRQVTNADAASRGFFASKDNHRVAVDKAAATLRDHFDALNSLVQSEEAIRLLDRLDGVLQKVITDIERIAEDLSTLRGQLEAYRDFYRNPQNSSLFTELPIPPHMEDPLSHYLGTGSEPVLRLSRLLDRILRQNGILTLNELRSRLNSGRDRLRDLLAMECFFALKGQNGLTTAFGQEEDPPKEAFVERYSILKVLRDNAKDSQQLRSQLAELYKRSLPWVSIAEEATRMSSYQPKSDAFIGFVDGGLESFGKELVKEVRELKTQNFHAQKVLTRDPSEIIFYTELSAFPGFFIGEVHGPTGMAQRYKEILYGPRYEPLHVHQDFHEYQSVLPMSQHEVESFKGAWKLFVQAIFFGILRSVKLRPWDDTRSAWQYREATDAFEIRWTDVGPDGTVLRRLLENKDNLRGRIQRDVEAAEQRFRSNGGTWLHLKALADCWFYTVFPMRREAHISTTGADRFEGSMATNVLAELSLDYRRKAASQPAPAPGAPPPPSFERLLLTLSEWAAPAARSRGGVVPSTLEVPEEERRAEWVFQDAATRAVQLWISDGRLSESRDDAGQLQIRYPRISIDWERFNTAQSRPAWRYRSVDGRVQPDLSADEIAARIQQAPRALHEVLAPGMTRWTPAADVPDIAALLPADPAAPAAPAAPIPVAPVPPVPVTTKILTGSTAWPPAPPPPAPPPLPPPPLPAATELRFRYQGAAGAHLSVPASGIAAFIQQQPTGQHRVWILGWPAWKEAADVPEIASLLPPPPDPAPQFHYMGADGAARTLSAPDILDLIAAAPTGYHMVWREGMPAWADARTVPEIADLAAPPA